MRILLTATTFATIKQHVLPSMHVFLVAVVLWPTPKISVGWVILGATLQVLSEKRWRDNYTKHVCQSAILGAKSTKNALDIAKAGLDEMCVLFKREDVLHVKFAVVLFGGRASKDNFRHLMSKLYIPPDLDLRACLG
jgi:hypothetical protein